MEENTTPPPTEKAFGLHDFSDRLSPMLVKELRQGLRTRTFTSIFLLLQGMLAFFVLIALSSNARADAGEAISDFVIGFFALAALIIQPMRGSGAISTEIKERTIDLMQLTRLNSWRIVLGKWTAIVSQTALLFATTIPYLVIRYFFGGMQLFTELSIVFVIFILSAAATGITVGLSANKSLIIRGIAPILGLFAGIALLGQLFSGRLMRGLISKFNFDDLNDFLFFAAFISFIIYVGYYALDMGATRIASLVENRATRKRLIGLTLILLIGIACSFISGSDRIAGYFLSLVVAIMVSIDCLSETPPSIFKVVEPFTKRGPLGRIAGRFLAPGWATGILFVILLFSITLFYRFHFSRLSYLRGNSSYSFGHSFGAQEIYMHCGIYYSLLLPVLIIYLFRKKITNIFTSYICILGGSAILSMLSYTMMDLIDDEIVATVGSFIPGMFAVFADEVRDDSLGLKLYSTYLILTLLALSVPVFREMKRMTALEKECLNISNGKNEEADPAP